MLEKYTTYLKDNPKGYWFKRKLYGWGWFPARWQGWFVIFAYIAILLGVIIPLAEKAEENSNFFYGIITATILLTALLIGICFYKGEKPRWQWGLPKKQK